MGSYPSWVVDQRVRVNCKECTAECCKHVAINIDTPKTWDDFQALSEYLQYDHVTVYKDNDGDWIVECKARCGQLDGNRCMAFKENKQPFTCREYSMKTCVMNSPGDYFTVFLATSEDVAAYAKKRGIKKPIRTTLAKKCNSDCCNHVTIPIDEPEEWRDYDDIRWYIAHKNIEVYKDDGDWFVSFKTQRKDPCAQCTQEQCKYDETDYDVHFVTWDDVETYLQKHNITPPTKLKLTSY